MDDAAGPGLTPIALAVVDDHPAIAAAIEGALRAEAETAGAAGTAMAAVRPIHLSWTARRVPEALDRLRDPAQHTDVVLSDVQLESGIDGLEVVRASHAAGVRVIVLTSFDRSSLMRAAFERGASGFLHKSTDVAEFLVAVRTVADGGTAFSAATLDAARTAPRPPSPRESEVITFIQRGATSDEIGLRLGISARTVESHVRRLFDRYGVVSRAELAVLAVQEGWIEAAGR